MALSLAAVPLLVALALFSTLILASPSPPLLTDSPPPNETIAEAQTDAESPSSRRRPNIIFLVCESTDGRTWRSGYQSDVIPLPNLRRLSTAPGGAAFHRHYANAPVCCPSRATFWSGRHAHNIPHVHNGMDVDGVWNNYEGLPRDYADRMDQILSREGGYDVRIAGKRDWTVGGHSLNVRLGSWTKQVRFPYDMNETGGWRYDYAAVCRSNGTVIKGNASAHRRDWDVLERTVDWIRNRSTAEGKKEQQRGEEDRKPFFVYQGMNIVHPPYATNEYWYSKIDPTKIDVPDWPDLDKMHPCDLQSSMLKGCVPSSAERPTVEDYYRRRNVRRIYYATIAEFDAMVGRYIDAVRDAGLENDTIFIVTSDHGDMQMEHRQTFKMVPYDASASVPMVIYDPTTRRRERNSPPNSPPPPIVVEEPTQLIDIFPTVLEYALIDRSRWPDGVDGLSLLALLGHPPSSSDQRSTTSSTLESSPGSSRRAAAVDEEKWDRSFVVSQFHGMNLAMSWFLIVKKMSPDGRAYKLVQYGTGTEVPPQLFDMTSDPDELTNLAHSPSTRHAEIISNLDASLRSVVDYPAVARDVARYDKRSFRWWTGNVTGDWREAVHAEGLRWTPSWDRDSAGAFEALERWLARPDDGEVLPCRSTMKWPYSAPAVAAAARNQRPGEDIQQVVRVE